MCVCVCVCVRHSLTCAPSLVACPSLATLTPVYGEDIVYALEGKRVAAWILGADKPDAELTRAAAGLPDLLTDSISAGTGDDGTTVPIITYLITIYSEEWENFKERYVHIHTHAHMRKHACTGTHKHTHTHRRIHTHTHTRHGMAQPGRHIRTHTQRDTRTHIPGLIMLALYHVEALGT